MRRVLLLLALLACAPAVTAQDETPPEFVIEIDAAGHATIVSGGGAVRHVSADGGSRYEWDVDVAGDYIVGEIRVRGSFGTARPEQLMPEWQDRSGGDLRTFAHVRHRDFEGSPLVNYTRAGGDTFLRLGLPGPGELSVILTRDTASPDFVVGPVMNLTSVRGAASFRVVTTTDEYAFADLQIRLVGAADWIRNPTTTLALEQTFPIQGLKDNSTYEWKVRFTDWSGNEAWSDEFTLETPASPGVPRPVVRIVEPAAGAVVETSRPTVRATIDAAGSPLAEDGITVFLDKSRAEGYAFSGGNLTFTLPELAAGKHTVRVEALNVAGGKAGHEVLFEVASGAPAPGLALVVAAAAAVALLISRR